MVTIALLTMGGLGLFFAAFLAIADKFLAVEENPLIGQVNEVLPGANCGACGKPGCYAYAESVVLEGAPVNGCPVGGEEVAMEVAALMGVEASSMEKLYPVIMCQGNNNKAFMKLVEYNGPKTCVAMDIVSGGDKLCMYGCLGGGDCVEVCTFNAMYMNDDGLPEVIKELCTGCGMCVKACPRNVIEMHPESHKVFVLCKNQDEGKKKRSVCQVVCLGCNACGKQSGGAVVIENGHGSIDYDKLNIDTVAFEKCRTGAIVNLEDCECVVLDNKVG